MCPRKLFLSAIFAIGCSPDVAHAAPFQLEELPYGYDALEPLISKKTLMTHHQKHHNKYVNTANQLIEKDATLKNKKDLSLEKIITTHQDNVSLFNNAAQIWNHNFYWHSMKPGGGGEPSGALAKAINKDFGSFNKFREELTNAALTAFGSGWAWLGYDMKKQKLVVTKTTGGAGNPLTDGITPILTIDVWEHAYYLDYQQDRPGYVNGFFTELANWEFAEMNYDGAVTPDKAQEL